MERSVWKASRGGIVGITFAVLSPLLAQAGPASPPRQPAPVEAITTPESSENAWDTSPTAAVGYSAAPVA